MFGNIYAGTMAPPRKDGLKMWRNKSDVTDYGGHGAFHNGNDA